MDEKVYGIRHKINKDLWWDNIYGWVEEEHFGNDCGSLFTQEELLIERYNLPIEGEWVLLGEDNAN